MCQPPGCSGEAARRTAPCQGCSSGRRVPLRRAVQALGVMELLAACCERQNPLGPGRTCSRSSRAWPGPCTFPSNASAFCKLPQASGSSTLALATAEPRDLDPAGILHVAAQTSMCTHVRCGSGPPVSCFGEGRDPGATQSICLCPAQCWHELFSLSWVHLCHGDCEDCDFQGALSFPGSALLLTGFVTSLFLEEPGEAPSVDTHGSHVRVAGHQTGPRCRWHGLPFLCPSHH